MKDWIPIVVGGICLGLMASSAVGSIKDDVILSCVQHNSENGRRGPSINRFCLCAAEVTAGEAGFLWRLLHKVRIEIITTPYTFGADFGKKVDALCNNL